MEEIILRAAKLTDTDSIYDKICELEQEKLNKNQFEDIFKQNLSKRNIYYIVAEYQGKLVGFMSLYIQNLLHHGGAVAEIQELFVDTTLRGKGLGTKLIEYARKISKMNKCVTFEVSCNLKRESTHVFYEKSGFSKTHFKFVSKAD